MFKYIYILEWKKDHCSKDSCAHTTKSQRKITEEKEEERFS